MCDYNFTSLNTREKQDLEAVTIHSGRIFTKTDQHTDKAYIKNNK